MAIAYHRRPLIESDDVAAMALAKLGSGNNLLCYYMVHGGTQPDGRLSTMQESQLTGYWNDLPVKTYDFPPVAPLPGNRKGVFPDAL
jgi:beta-galactosidase